MIIHCLLGKWIISGPPLKSPTVFRMLFQSVCRTYCIVSSPKAIIIGIYVYVEGIRLLPWQRQQQRNGRSIIRIYIYSYRLTGSPAAFRMACNTCVQIFLKRKRAAANTVVLICTYILELEQHSSIYIRAPLGAISSTSHSRVTLLSITKILLLRTKLIHIYIDNRAAWTNIEQVLLLYE